MQPQYPASGLLFLSLRELGREPVKIESPSLSLSNYGDVGWERHQWEIAHANAASPGSRRTILQKGRFVGGALRLPSEVGPPRCLSVHMWPSQARLSPYVFYLPGLALRCYSKIYRLSCRP